MPSAVCTMKERRDQRRFFLVRPAGRTHLVRPAGRTHLEVQVLYSPGKGKS